jgi:hypothetical protein
MVNTICKIKTLVGRRDVLIFLGCEINKRCCMVKAGNLESKRRDGVGDGQGQMPLMR